MSFKEILFHKEFKSLRSYCENEKFKGWDPYDGLNSKVFQLLPFKYSSLCRLVMIQGFKRSPINFRRLFLVPKEYNSKGLALFLEGYCKLFHLVAQDESYSKYFGSKEEISFLIKEIADTLISLKVEGYSGACWGYNFDWQARRLFLFPKNTPTVVATSFAVSALFLAYECVGEERYKEVALSSADFVIKDLRRTKVGDGFLFSYSPLKGNDTVFNASLLGVKVLSLCYHYSRNQSYLTLARQTVQTVVEAQNDDGSWVYGLLPVQSWIDSFHTGYNLESLFIYEKLTGDKAFHLALEKGLNYYIETFFKADGTPMYYHNKQYPIDIHCPAELIRCLSILGEKDKYKDIIEAVLFWTCRNMQDPLGFFYYQLKKGISSKISYMRWSNAFMFNAMCHYFA